MAISESSLHPYIKGLVEESGKLTVTDLNKYLRDILVLDSNDLTILTGRNDDKFSQIVRNVVAHAPDGISNKNGYIIDKTKKPAVFYAKEFNIANLTETKISNSTIKERRDRKRKFTARKIDFKTINNENSALGDAGENFALEWERKRLKDLNVSFDIMDEVIHFSRKYGDGAGYDILSRKDNNYELLYIEVKTTKSGLNTPFYMSENEKLFMDIYKENTLIYRVYNYNHETNVGEIEIITQSLLENEYIFNPITYKVSKK
ncbi:MAG: DUF3883 domain-containing protein [Clostridia bacterium]